MQAPPEENVPRGPDRRASQAAEPRLVVDTIRDFTQWTAIEHEWRTLFDASPTAAPPLRWEWQRDWWRLYAPVCVAASANDDGLRIVTARRAGRLTGLLPMYLNAKTTGPVRMRRLMWISTGEPERDELCAEYPDLLHVPGEGPACARAMLTAICEDKTADWDGLDLLHLGADSPVLEAARSSTIGGLEVRPHGPAYVAELWDGFEACLSHLSHNSRGLARKHLRRAERAGGTLELAHDAASAEEMFAELRGLHQARWNGEGQPGCFSSTRFDQFHRAQAIRGVTTGEAVLARLRCRGETLAVLLGYTAAGKFDSYVSGARTDEGEALKSPGIVLHLLLTEHLSRNGIHRYDHLAGDARYKQQFTTGEIARCSLHISRATLRSALGQTIDLARGAARKGRQLLNAGRSAAGAPPPNPPILGGLTQLNAGQPEAASTPVAGRQETRRDA